MIKKIKEKISNIDYLDCSVTVAFTSLLIVCMVMFGGCTSDKTDSKVNNSIMRTVETHVGCAVLVDIETNVMYLKSSNGGISVMVNSDGLPKLCKIGEEK